MSSGTFDFFAQDELPGPALTLGEAQRIAHEKFCIDGVASELGSQQDANFLLIDEQGQRAVLKIANPAFSRLELEAQDAATRHLAERQPGLRLPISRAGASGATIETVDVGGEPMLARVIEHLGGGTLSGGGYLPPAAVASLGEVAARVSSGLADFAHPGTERTLQWDLRHAAAVVDRLAPYISDGSRRAAVLDATARASAAVATLAGRLPVQAIHGDVADDNVVCTVSAEGYRVADGVIDFGDVMTSWRVAELAVAISSVLHHAGASPLTALPAVRAFHAIASLTGDEVDALWALVVLRGAVLVASGNQQASIDEGNDYATGAVEHEWRIFEVADSVPLAVMTGVLREALGLGALGLDGPGSDGLGAATSPATVPPVVAPLLPALDPSAPAVLSLSSDSDEMNEGRWLAASVEFDAARRLLATGADAVITPYGERRLSRSAAMSPEAPAVAALSTSVFLPVPTAVHAPWSGRLERRDDAVELVSRGVRLVLRGVDTGVASGTQLRAGQQLGTTAVVAAGLSALSVQLVTIDGAAPEFVQSALFAGWSVVSPDATYLLGQSFPEPVEGEGAVDTGSLRQAQGTGAAQGTEAAQGTGTPLLERRAAVFADVQEHYYADPPRIERGWRHTLVDTDARCYLDMVNNVASVGHAHPRIAEAAYRQLQRFNSNSRFNYSSVVELSERLTALLPDPLDTVFLVNSGSEADDLALRIAWAWSGRQDVVSVREAYHGWTFATDAVSTSVADNPDALETRPDWVHTVPAPNAYRGELRGADATHYAGRAAAEIRELTASGHPPAAFLAEAFYGNAGGMPLPDGYLAEVYAAVREAGGLAIADEVQVGYGRLGEWFWGFEQQGVVPDIVTIAKAMGNGHPLGAVITSREVADNYRNQGYFFSSAGGSPVSSVIGLAVLDILRDEGLQENARVVGGHLRSRLGALGDAHELVGAVHGSGLYLGLEFVTSRETLEPATRETAAICERMRELGVIIQATGDRQNILKIKPPLTLTIEAADYFVDMLDRVLAEGFGFDERRRSA
ncbi:aminotransferase class III-fold pyridoxal phosphate-dependent enzyme [Agreia sp. Leaf283]|uniref:aminotransferase class III-fold pyridoxal phosphate-dependent enzyme n=1 Tax=Agreia sp. Leaf283 TaxID=1736321 RepID=UPI000701C4E6|nr:aminotransferase class III-fold pyridoxal phosphate-dependent enzyme [Agreia sp. Leaf283]KQP56969.1 4-aminobutyrate aminotransferase [Agreia sp. Leaf283]